MATFTFPYDPLVFAWGFDVADEIPVFNQVLIQREFKKVEAGQAVAFQVNIQDLTTSLGQRFNFDPATTPQVEIYNPNGSTKVAFTNMSFFGLTGYYTYQHQTLINDAIGIYTARFKAINGSMTSLTDKIAMFEVTSQ